MAIAFRAATSGSKNGTCGTTSIPVTAPAGLADGDLIVVIIDVKDSCCGAPRSITAPSGWTNADNSQYTTLTRSSIFYKLASGEGASWNFSVLSGAGSTTVNTRWGCAAYSGCDQTTPLDATTTAQTNASSTNLSCPSITTVTNNAMILSIVTFNGTGAITDAGGTTQRIDNETAGGSCYLAENIQASAGASGGEVPTIVGAKVSRGVTIALRPAAGSGTNWALTATISGASALSGSLGLARPLNATISAVSAIAGSLMRNFALGGTISGASAISASLMRNFAVNSTISAASAFSGTLLRNQPLASLISAASTLAGTLKLNAAGLGSMSGASALSGSMGVNRGMSGTISTNSNISGTLSVLAGNRAPGVLGDSNLCDSPP